MELVGPLLAPGCDVLPSSRLEMELPGLEPATWVRPTRSVHALCAKSPHAETLAGQPGRVGPTQLGDRGKRAWKHGLQHARRLHQRPAELRYRAVREPRINPHGASGAR